MRSDRVGGEICDKVSRSDISLERSAFTRRSARGAFTVDAKTDTNVLFSI